MFATAGNHDYLVQQAFGSKHPCPPDGKLLGGLLNQTPLTEDEKKRIREAYQTQSDASGKRWYFGEHDRIETTLDGHPISAFLSAYNHKRGPCDGYTFHEKDAKPLGMWKELEQPTDFVVTHGPAYCNFTSLKPGETLTDRHGVASDVPGSKSLADALEKAKPSIYTCGHVHNAYGHHSVLHSDGSSGQVVNAACVISGDAPGRTRDAPGRRLEYHTPRAPFVFDWCPATGVSTLVSKWDGTVNGEEVEPPNYARPITREPDEVYTAAGLDMADQSMEMDKSMVKVSLKTQRIPRTEDAVSAWRDKCRGDQESRSELLERAGLDPSRAHHLSEADCS